MEFERLGYRFKYFFDADVDEMCQLDVEGYDVYDENDNLIAELNFFTKEDIDEMEDWEVSELINECLV